VKIGVLVDMDLGQLLADWIDPTILAIEARSTRVSGAAARSRSSPPARAACRENYRKLIEGLQVARRTRLRGDTRADDFRQLPHVAAVRRRDRRTRHRLDARTALRARTATRCANGDIPTEGVMCANWLLASAA
jgi:hypothetical protein